VESVAPCTRDAGGWAQFQNDVRNSGTYPDALPVSQFTADSIRSVDDRDGGIVAGPDGRILFGSGTTLHAYDAWGSEERWSKRLDSEIDTSPSIYCDSVFVAVSDTVYALDAADGTTRWKQTLGSIVSPPLVVDETVFVATLETVYALKLQDGSVRWEFSSEDGTNSGLCAGQESLFMTTTQPSSIRAIDRETGDPVWSTSVDSGIPAPPTFDHSDVLATDDAGTTYRLDAASGEVEWKRSTAGGRAPTPVVAGDRVFVPSGNGDETTCLRRADGEPLWSLSTGPVLSPPIATSGPVLLGTMNAGVYVVSKEGEVVHHLETTNVGSPMALTSKGLFFKTRFPNPEAVRVY
jgi:outer membrane protein assembly factor BamB